MLKPPFGSLRGIKEGRVPCGTCNYLILRDPSRNKPITGRASLEEVGNGNHRWKLPPLLNHFRVGTGKDPHNFHLEGPGIRYAHVVVERLHIGIAEKEAWYIREQAKPYGSVMIDGKPISFPQCGKKLVNGSRVMLNEANGFIFHLEESSPSIVVTPWQVSPSSLKHSSSSSVDFDSVRVLSDSRKRRFSPSSDDFNVDPPMKTRAQTRSISSCNTPTDDSSTSSSPTNSPWSPPSNGRQHSLPRVVSDSEESDVDMLDETDVLDTGSVRLDIKSPSNAASTPDSINACRCGPIKMDSLNVLKNSDDHYSDVSDSFYDDDVFDNEDDSGVSAAINSADSDIPRYGLQLADNPDIIHAFPANETAICVGSNPNIENTAALELNYDGIFASQCTINITANGCVITDLGTGTRVNGWYLQAYGESYLAPGDTVQFGETTLEFIYFFPLPTSKDPNIAKRHSTGKPLMEEMTENSTEGILRHKMKPLVPYLTKHGAPLELFQRLDKHKKHYSKTFIDTVSKSTEDGCCINTYSSYKTLSAPIQRRTKIHFNMLVRLRFGAEKEQRGQNSFTSECVLKESCFNLYHHVFTPICRLAEPRIIGSHTFVRDKPAVNQRWEYWACLACKSLLRKLYFHSFTINGHVCDTSSSLGYLKLNPVTKILEDPTQKNRKVNADMPGGIPHICNQKAYIDAELEMEASRVAISIKRKKIMEIEEELHKKCAELHRDFDESKSSETLKRFLQKYNDGFPFHQQHRKYFVYFITIAGSKKILYFGITHQPPTRLYVHLAKGIFKKELRKGIHLEMHLMPLGNINVMTAMDLETLFIRLSKSGHLSCSRRYIRNKAPGNYASTQHFARNIVGQKGQNFFQMVSCLNELIQHTFDYGASIHSTGRYYRITYMQFVKSRLASYLIKYRGSKTSDSNENAAPSQYSFKHVSENARSHIDDWRETFTTSAIQANHFVYFFTYENEDIVLYYGISCNPKKRWLLHRSSKKGPMYSLFRGPKKLQMHIMPLGKINLMMAAEIETLLIRLSKGNYLYDGNVALNISNGRFSTAFSVREESMLTCTGEKFDTLVEVMNELIRSTFEANNFLSSSALKYDRNLSITKNTRCV